MKIIGENNEEVKYSSESINVRAYLKAYTLSNWLTVVTRDAVGGYRAQLLRLPKLQRIIYLD